MTLEDRRISPRMGLPILTVLEGDASYEQGYHNEEGGLLPLSKALVEESQEVPAQEEEEQHEARWQAEGIRAGRRQRHLVRALDRLPVEGSSSGLVWGLFECHPRTFPEMDEDGYLREADEKDD